MANSEMDYIHGYMADQTYDPTSMNAQSGIAVAEALTTKIKSLGGISPNTSKVFNLSAGTRVLVISNHSSVDGYFSMYMVTTGAIKAILTSSIVTMTLNDSKLTITNSGGGTAIVQCIVLNGTITEAT